MGIIFFRICRLACFELHHTFFSSDQLQSEVTSHYISQGLRQFYVLVFGLDVIGNPYGLAMGVAKGVEAFFYEPFHVRIKYNNLIKPFYIDFYLCI